MIFPPHHARPSALPLRLIIGGATMAVLYLLLQGGSLVDAASMLTGLDPANSAATPKTITLLACGRTFIVISVALLTSSATAITLVGLTRHLWPSASRVTALAGQLLFAAPVFGLIWTWIGWWIGSQGGVIETILPPQPQDPGEDLIGQIARHLWTWLAPILAIATPLTGLLLVRFSANLHPTAFSPLTDHLRARGLSPARLFDYHLFPLLWPGWLRCLESSLFAVLVLDLVVDSTLNFPGWGTAFVHAMKSQNPSSVAFGLHTSGILAGLICGVLFLFQTRAPPSAIPQLCDHFRPPPLLVLIALVIVAIAFLLVDLTNPLHLQNTRLASGETWLPSWQSDLNSCVRIIGLALVGGTVLAALRLTVLGAWLRRYGSLESLVWSPLPLWALAWSHTSGQVIGIDLSLAVLAAITLSIHLSSSTHRCASSRLMEASRTLGATSLQAWRQHALRPWLREFSAFLITLVGSAWWLRVFMHSLLPAGKTAPATSLGSFLSHAATDGLHHPLPLLSASIGAGVSILSLWSLGHIIHQTPPSNA